MDYEQLLAGYSVGVAHQACFSTKVRMWLEHELRDRQKLEERYAQQVDRLKEKDTEIASLKAQLSLKEAEATEAIRLQGQIAAVEAAEATRITKLNSLRERNVSLEGQVTALESAVVSKDAEIASSQSYVAKLTHDLSSLQLSCDELSVKASSLVFEKDKPVDHVSGLEVTCSGLRDEVMGYKLFKERVEELHDEQMRVLSDRVAIIDSDLMEMVLHMDAEFYPRYLTTIVGRRWILSRGVRLVLAKCLVSPEYLYTMGEAIGRDIDKVIQDGLIAGIEHGRAKRSITDVVAFNPFVEGDYVAAINALRDVNFPLLAQLEANKGSSMADIMDLLLLEGPAANAFEASHRQPSPEQLMVLIHRLEDQVIIRETPLDFSLEVAHNHVQRVRGDATSRRLSLTDSILPLMEPLSARSLTGEASSSAVLATAVTTALSTTFSQTDPVPSVLSTERSKLIPKASSFLIISTFAVLQVGMPISTRITASVPYVSENGVSLLIDLVMVRCAHKTCEISSIQCLLLSSNHALIPSPKLFTPVFEWVIPELFSVVRYYFPWQTESAYYVIPYKLLNLSSCYGRAGLTSIHLESSFVAGSLAQGGEPGSHCIPLSASWRPCECGPTQRSHGPRKDLLYSTSFVTTYQPTLRRTALAFFFSSERIPSARWEKLVDAILISASASYSLL
uniref:Ankyrin repeat family protein n=1 Tax=Tanacetum cinerariifolium TaxID=118510 RepID=A0A6L2MR68_TANCI|nr:ankyrin repeat family protein [Tanacetum cinerariifolium]